MSGSRSNPQVSRVKLLEVARDRLASEIDGCEARELPAIVRELRLVTAELAALVGDGESQNGGTVDDLAAKRRARRATSA
jgi:hypothetical protein